MAQVGPFPHSIEQLLDDQFLLFGAATDLPTVTRPPGASLVLACPSSLCPSSLCPIEEGGSGGGAWFAAPSVANELSAPDDAGAVQPSCDVPDWPAAG